MAASSYGPPRLLLPEKSGGLDFSKPPRTKEVRNNAVAERRLFFFAVVRQQVSFIFLILIANPHQIVTAKHYFDRITS